MSESVVVLEFNELAPNLMDRFIAQGHLPNFARLRGQSIVAVTDAEEAPPALEPWIQWPTVHTGQSYAKHRVFELGVGHQLDTARVWDVASDAGRKVWVCGSMNAGCRAPLNGHLLPDPWSPDSAAQPHGTFAPFHRFVSTYVQEHTRTSVPVTKGDYARFAAFMATNGLSFKTGLEIAKQLASERLGGGRHKRATILDRLQWDVFRAHYRRLKPALATFFVNSTAHFQHFYWRHMEPEVFKARPPESERAAHHDAILYGYKKMDELVGECLELVDDHTTVVLCTALSQQPMLKYEATGGKQLFRPHDVAQLAAFAGIEEPFRHEPVMSNEFHLVFSSPEAAQAAEQRLRALRFEDGRELMVVSTTGAQLLASGHPGFAVPAGAKVVSPSAPTPRAFAELFYSIGATSGMHHPDGILWIRRPGQQATTLSRKVSLREIAPTLLACLGIDAPETFELPPMPEVAGAPSRPETVQPGIRVVARAIV